MSRSDITGLPKYSSVHSSSASFDISRGTTGPQPGLGASIAVSIFVPSGFASATRVDRAGQYEIKRRRHDMSLLVVML